MVLKSNENMFVQTLKSCCDKKVKFNFVTVPDDEDMGTADSLRLLKDIIKVIWVIFKSWLLNYLACVTFFGPGKQLTSCKV